MARDSDYARQIFKVDKTTGESLSMSESDFIKLLQSSISNPEVQVNDTHFSLKKAYPIYNRESLMQYLLEHGHRGIQDDERFRYCYKGIENDIEALISKGWVRVIKTQDVNIRKDGDKKRIFFPRNKHQDDVEADFPEQCQSYLADLWEKKVGDIANIKWQQILQSGDQNLLSEKEREILVTRQIKSQCKEDDEKAISDRLNESGFTKRTRATTRKFANSHCDIDFSQAF